MKTHTLVKMLVALCAVALWGGCKKSEGPKASDAKAPAFESATRQQALGFLECLVKKVPDSDQFKANITQSLAGIKSLPEAAFKSADHADGLRGYWNRHKSLGCTL